MRLDTPKTFAITLIAIATLSLSIVGLAGAAQAPRWTVGGAFLGAGAGEALTGKSTEATWLSVHSLPLRLNTGKEKCELVEAKISGSAAESPGTASMKLRCTEVGVDGLPACRVNGTGEPFGTITTNNLTGTLVWLAKEGQKAGLTITAAPPKSAVVELNFSGEGCPIHGASQILNGVIGEVLPIGEDVTTGTLRFPPTASTTCKEPILKDWSNGTPRIELPHTQLTIAENPMDFCTSFSLHLKTDKNGASPPARSQKVTVQPWSWAWSLV